MTCWPLPMRRWHRPRRRVRTASPSTDCTDSRASMNGAAIGTRRLRNGTEARCAGDDRRHKIAARHYPHRNMLWTTDASEVRRWYPRRTDDERSRPLRQAYLPHQGDRRGVLPADHLHGMSDLLLGAAPRSDLG